MKNLYTIMAALLSIFTVAESIAQPCTSLVISNAVPSESRCMATGKIQVTVSGGSGNYNYKVSGPVNTNYTSSSEITGLSAGTYTVDVKDVSTNCSVQRTGVIIVGSYTDPRFTLNKSDETCKNKSDGTITLNSQVGGRDPYVYTIVAPSPNHIGESNSTGTFTGLGGGDYSIELKDSCGGIQTRRVFILAYDWWIEASNGNRINCQDASFDIRLKDSRGNVNTSGTAFDGFQYGVVNSIGDTTWYNSHVFTHPIGTKRVVSLPVKDLCGNIRVINWTNPVYPSVANLVTTTYVTCNSFSAEITGQTNLVNPTYCLYTTTNTLVGCNSTGLFTGIAAGTYYINVADACFDTTIRRDFVLAQPKPSLAPNVTLNRTDCNTFSASVDGATNFINPQFCLLNSVGTQLSCNSTGSFTNIPNGDYCIAVRDGCYDTTVTRCFTMSRQVPSVDANVTVSDRECGTFDVSIEGHTNLTNPNFCLYTASGTLVSCNTSGVFDNIAYGDYCMRIQNAASCYDTLITRCFSVLQEAPSVNANLDVVKHCNTVDISIAGLRRFLNPQFCLYDAANVQVSCNTTGSFTGLPYGTYCMQIRNDPACYDTTITRCVTVTKDLPSIGDALTSNFLCSGFDVGIDNEERLVNPVFTLLTASGTVVATNSTGDFGNVPYGSYCIDMKNDPNCYDTTIRRCFSASLPVPSVGTVQVSDRSCTGFAANIESVDNMQNPSFVLRNASGTIIASNNTGYFTDIPYGNNCISVTDPCYDTTIERCFSASPVTVAGAVSASASCELNKTTLRIIVTSGSGPYTVTVFDPADNQVGMISGASTTLRVYNLPDLPGSQQYRVVITDNCGNQATRMVSPIVSTFTSNLSVMAKCPSGSFQNGSSELTIVVASNLGTIRPTIIRQNGAVVNIPYNTGSTTTYKWPDLGPATYVIQYNLPGSCTNKAFDTIAVGPYRYPELGQSASYQCDNNSFSVGAVVTGGAPPYLYEIIGSVPAAPSIIAAPQSNPVFNINNGNMYSLVRLRALDYCGNATLNDVSVLPLQNIVASTSSDCYYAQIDLSVDSIANASYTWYLKTSATDSVWKSDQRVYHIPELMPGDIGTYVCRIDVNGTCLIRLAYFTLTGGCGGTLPGNLELTGREIENKNYLSWNQYLGEAIQFYVVEKKQGNSYITLGQVKASQTGQSAFGFTDDQHGNKTQQYRVKAIAVGGKLLYSNTVSINRNQYGGLQVYPNPVIDEVHIQTTAAAAGHYKMVLYTATGQQVYIAEKAVQAGERIDIPRQPSMKPGIYLIRILHRESDTETVEKLLFK